MLESLTKRIREIGVHMAIGTKGKDVLIRFVIESILLSFLGGFIGIAFGIVVYEMVATFGGLKEVIMLPSILISAIVGIFFGRYPAMKVAVLNAIDALRHE